jgi:hypothetical protein
MISGSVWGQLMKEAPAAAARSTCATDTTVAAPNASGGNVSSYPLPDVGAWEGQKEEAAPDEEMRDARAFNPSKPAGDSAGTLTMVRPACRSVCKVSYISVVVTPRKTATRGHASRHANAWASLVVVAGPGSVEGGEKPACCVAEKEDGEGNHAGSSSNGLAAFMDGCEQ